MDKAVWQMQQEAELRVRRMRERSQRLIEERQHRSAASLTAARAAVAAMTPRDNAPVPAPCPPPVVREEEPFDRERWMLLLLALLLYRSGGNAPLVLALLYLAV